MENTQPCEETKMENKNESGSKAATSDASTKLPPSVSTDPGGFKSSSGATNATTPNVSPKTWKSAELDELKSKAGQVAGALRDFQDAKGLVAIQSVTYNRDGKAYQGIKLILVAEGLNLVAVDSPDDLGLDFDLVAASGTT